MAKEATRVTLAEFTAHVTTILERVVRERETVVVEQEGDDLAVVKPAPVSKQKRRPRNKAADEQAFLSSAGGWKGLVDTEKLKEDIYESRRISTRPPVNL